MSALKPPRLNCQNVELLDLDLPVMQTIPRGMNSLNSHLKFRSQICVARQSRGLLPSTEANPCQGINLKHERHQKHTKKRMRQNIQVTLACAAHAKWQNVCLQLQNCTIRFQHWQTNNTIPLEKPQRACSSQLALRYLAEFRRHHPTGSNCGVLAYASRHGQCLNSRILQSVTYAA